MTDPSPLQERIERILAEHPIQPPTYAGDAPIAVKRERTAARIAGEVAAEVRAAKAERDEWRQTALDERAAALDALEQVKARDVRIKAVQDVLDQAEASINRHPAYTFSGQRMDPIVNGADIRRALEG